MKLYGGYSIVSDTYNYILQKEQVVKEGKHKGENRIVNVAYFGSLRLALLAYADRRCSDYLSKEEATMNGLLDLLKTIEEEVKKINDEGKCNNVT